MVQKENESIRDAECMSSLKENKQISVHYEQSYLERISFFLIYCQFERKRCVKGHGDKFSEIGESLCCIISYHVISLTNILLLISMYKYGVVWRKRNSHS